MWVFSLMHLILRKTWSIQRPQRHGACSSRTKNPVLHDSCSSFHLVPSHVKSSPAIYTSSLLTTISSTLQLFLLPPVNPLSTGTQALLPLALKIATRRKKRHALIHDRLADPEVVIDPLLDARCFGELVWLYTGTVSGGVVSEGFLVGGRRCVDVEVVVDAIWSGGRCRRVLERM